jgi:toxin ParE1/3/4
MQRLKVTYRPEARHDLSKIFEIILQRSNHLITAENFVLRITKRCEAIGNAPYGGRSRNDLEEGLRTVPFEKTAVITYKVETDRIRIFNIFYGGRDYEALFG